MYKKVKIDIFGQVFEYVFFSLHVLPFGIRSLDVPMYKRSMSLICVNGFFETKCYELHVVGFSR